jgi:hypothetical protein
MVVIEFSVWKSGKRSEPLLVMLPLPRSREGNESLKQATVPVEVGMGRQVSRSKPCKKMP